MNLNLIAPKNHAVNQEVVTYLKELTSVEVSDDLTAALKKCDVLFIDNDYGQDFYVNKETLESLSKQACVLHSSPLTDAEDADINIMDDYRCKIADSGANVVYVLSSVLELLIG